MGGVSIRSISLSPVNVNPKRLFALVAFLSAATVTHQDEDLLSTRIQLAF